MAANWLVPEPWEESRRTADPCHTWRGFFEQLQPFRGHAVFKTHETGDVAARPRQAVDETGADWIAKHRGHNRHGAGHLQQWSYGRGAMGQDDVRREREPILQRVCEFQRHCSWPNGYQSARFGRCSSLIAAILAGTPRATPEIPHRPQSQPGSRRSAACAQAVARELPTAKQRPSQQLL